MTERTIENDHSFCQARHRLRTTSRRIALHCARADHSSLTGVSRATRQRRPRAGGPRPDRRAPRLRVFAEKGYRGPTIADVVRESGLSVGAIYTYFSGKDELILASCDQIAARGLDELGKPPRAATTTAERLAIAIRLYFETIDDYEGEPGQVTLVQAWAEADREPGVREMLAARRERLAGPRRCCCARGSPAASSRRGSTSTRSPGLPRAARRADAPADRGRRGVPPGRSRAPREGHRRAPGSESRGPLAGRCRDRPDGVASARDGPRSDRPRSDRPGRPRLHAAARAHRRSRCGTSRRAGTTGSSPATGRSSSRSSRATARPAAAASST